jgi:SAM-dependent methyltransferase
LSRRETSGPDASALEAASFRDPHNRVFYANGRVFRALSEQGIAEWDALVDTGLAGELTAEGKLVRTERANGAVSAADLPHALEAAAVLEHERIPFVSYPYEWPFAMLRDAALLQLELLRRAVSQRLVLKDATPYNVQWQGARPVFADVGSFERLREGEAWAGYRQFCMLFLYPLLLQAWKGVPFQPWLRGSLEGIAPQEMRGLLSFRDLFRRGALTHVVLHNRLERRYDERQVDVKGELRSAGFRPELIEANARRLERLVSRLRWAPGRSTWSEYGATTSYSADDAARKERFVADAAEAERPALAWDVGCNEGRHARIVARHAGYVVAMDADDLVVDRLYAALRSEGVTNVLPLVADAVDPSPGLGWRTAERRPAADRGRPDFALCLAVLHHISIGRNVPVADAVDWLRDLTGKAVVEFATPEDPMVQRLLARKREDDHPDYRRDWFERCLAERFETVRMEELADGRRILYHVRARS